MKSRAAIFILLGCLVIGSYLSPRAARAGAASGKNIFTAERCAACHAGPLGARGESNSHAGWQYALLWNPEWLIQNKSMPSYAGEFKLIQASISKREFDAPSGDAVYGLSPTPELKKLFTFNPAHLILIFLSAVTWDHPPVSVEGLAYGLKAFTDRAAWPGEKADGYPVAWTPQELKGAIHPGEKLTLVVPTEKLAALVAYAQSRYRRKTIGWLSVKVPPHPADMSAAEGKRLFDLDCAACHGPLGNGQGPDSVFVYPKPRDFTSREFKFKTTPADEVPTGGDLFRTITAGLPGTAMPSFAYLSAAERWDLAAYVKTLAIDPATGKSVFIEHPMTHPVPVREPALQGAALDAAIQKGKEIFYNVAKCNDCHGPGFNSKDRLPHGDGPSSASQTDDWGYPIRPANLASGVLKRGNLPADIYLDVTTGIVGTPMPSYLDTLTEADRWDLAFYVSALNRKRGAGRGLAPGAVVSPN